MKRAIWMVLAAALGVAASHAQAAPTQATVITGASVHKTTLAWGASPAPFAVGYNVYRCTGTPATCGAPFTGVVSNFAQTPSAGWTKIIGSINASQLQYVDLSVTAGATYCYVVTAYDTTGVNWESIATNVLTGTIPSSSVPPGGGISGQTPPASGLTGTVQ